MSYGENRLKLNQLKSDITIIIGPNGSGKTSSLSSLKKELKKKDETIIHFSSKKNDALSSLGSPLRNSSTDTSLLSIGNSFLSEGERINSSFDIYFMETMLPILQNNEKDTSWVLIDELDSGLSYDRLYRLLEMIVRIKQLEKKMANKEMNIILTANSYELIDSIKELNENVLIYDIEKEKYVEINSYKDFKSLYMDRLNYLKENDK